MNKRKKTARKRQTNGVAGQAYELQGSTWTPEPQPAEYGSDQRKLAGAVSPILVYERAGQAAHLTLSRVVSATVRGRSKLMCEGEPQGGNRPAPEPSDTPSEGVDQTVRKMNAGMSLRR